MNQVIMRKTWIKVKRGLLELKHREKLGIRIWLYLYILDLVDWTTGTIDDWKDVDHAKAIEIPVRTLQSQRQQLQGDGYITCVQVFQGQKITVNNWTNPREYSGEVYNPAGEGTPPERTTETEGTQSRVPIQSESRVPLHIDHKKNHSGLPSLPDTYQESPPALEAWKDFVQMRREKKKPLTPTAAKRLIAKLEKYPLGVAVAALQKSVENDWQGVFPESIKPDEIIKFKPSAPTTHTIEVDYGDGTFGEYEVVVNG